MSKPPREKRPAQRIPTTEKLAQALQDAGAPAEMIHRAKMGRYDDFKSQSATPIADLVSECRAAGLHTIVERAIKGEFDAQIWESEAWRNSPEGRETFKHFGKYYRND